MRAAAVYRNGVFAGILTEGDRGGYTFRYDDAYFKDNSKYSISLTMPKTKQEYRGDYMFPFFSNLVAEGTNLSIQSRYLKIDDRDIMSLLAATASVDTIGAVTVKLIEQP